MRRHPLLQFAGIPITAADIRLAYPELASPEKKILSLEKNGELIRLKRDLYIVSEELTGQEVDARLCANHLYGPSYISMQWALRYYGMIPEQVYGISSITTKRSHNFSTPIGYFCYKQVPQNYFPIGIESTTENNISFLIARPEKALCDTILFEQYVPSKSQKALYTYLEEDLRLDMDTFAEMDTEIFLQCANAGKKTQIFNNLIKILQK